MPRKPRIHYPGAVYHVIARGNNRENIFNKEPDKEKYLNLLIKYKEKHDFYLYAYAFMDNHLHLLIEVKDVPLSTIMQALQVSYTQYFNKKYDRVGHVFQQRYKAILCRKDKYLLTLIRYIHENPVKAGLSHTLEYKWSSHKDYIKAQNHIVSIEPVMGYFDNGLREAVNKYMQFMQDPQDDSIQKYILAEECQPAEPAVMDFEIADSSGIAVTLEELQSRIALNYSIPAEMIIRKSKIPRLSRARRMFLFLAVNNGLLTRSQAAEYLGISQSAVTRAINEIDNNRALKGEIDDLSREMSRKLQCKA